MLYEFIFLNLLKVSSGSMHLCVCNHQPSRISDGVNINLVLVNTDLLGVGRRGGFFSYKFTPDFWSGCNPHIGFFSFIICIALSDLDILSRAPLYS